MSQVFFTRTTSDGKIETWATDQTPAGAHIVRAASPDRPTFSDDPTFTNYHTWVQNGRNLFIKTTGVNEGGDLWKSDGTAAGTSKVKDLPFGNGGLLVDHVNGKVVFDEAKGALANGMYTESLLATEGSIATLGSTITAYLGGNFGTPYSTFVFERPRR